MNDNYISTQICVYKTNKVLVEFLDKLKPASVNTYAHLHATGDYVDSNGRKAYSLIGITMLDYSKGTGDKTVRTKANISPDEAMYIHSRLAAGYQVFEFSQDKIFGTPDAYGYSDVTKLRICRYPQDANGKPKTYPWFVQIANGKGIAVKNKTGGTYMKSGSYMELSVVTANLNDLDMFKLVNRVSCYISTWEQSYGPASLFAGRQAMEAAIQQATAGQPSYDQASCYEGQYPDQHIA
jgi:hypothetical protein